MLRSIVSVCSVMLMLSVTKADAASMVNPSSSTDTCKSVYFPALSSLDSVLKVDEFRIHYSVHGKNSLEVASDADRNGTPDMIDDLALQLTTARSLYSDVFGLRHPLRQPRYVDARHINVFVFAMEMGNGKAFDEVVSERIRQTQTECALRIFVDHRVQPGRNLTPAHELFHLYQYGYSMFKSKWYLEGMARWVESSFRDRKPTTGATPQVMPIACDDVYKASYAASKYWEQQMRASGATTQAIPDWLRARRYSDGRDVIENERFQGSDFLLSALQGLKSASIAAATDQNLPPYLWAERLQKSAQFDQLICNTIQKVVTEMSHSIQ